ncbi:hypothetical protein RI129_006864 [Pyrocoelia pectoralis]|uniref:Uncharacterized protein n=1 Tax=Pyrocoelia pectoralis TaxID=417401 RepID=A0AAN7VFZ3_9COLE
MKLLILVFVSTLCSSTVYCRSNKIRQRKERELLMTWSPTEKTTKGPCSSDCSGGILVESDGPCWECIYIDTCVMFGCPNHQFCFSYNKSFPLDQYLVYGECRKNPCMEEPLDENGLTTACNDSNKCPTGHICAESVCCKELQTSTPAS